ncbi:MAG TPA: glycosyltransferase family 2 protein [Solirubrobacteraceae bacterium]|jgi:N-acetylglucosaminyl-diphospho-decaprenol L-rhamnosyltransferase|nr:glycosyltransferase family 2 protein [Solirubrobacteraceae bacterium]
MAPLSIDVVVVAFNHFDLTESCLRHLAAQTRDHRLIVSDNGSTDGTAERVRRMRPDAEIVRFEDNQRFAVACNAGVAAGDGDVVVLLNNDVDARPDFLERLVAPLERHSSIGSVAALCIRPDERHIDSIGMTADVTLSGFPRLQGRPVEEAASPEPALVGPAGTAAAYRRSAWDHVGGLDEHFTAYFEDFDLALRLRAAGWGTVAAPDAVAVHLGSATFGHRSTRQRELGGFGRAYMLRRYRLLRGRGSLRTALTEGIVIAGDALISRDLAATRGRLSGWRAARRLPPRRRPPQEAVDASITLRRAIALRRGVYSRGRR